MKHKDVVIPGALYAELIVRLRTWKTRHEYGYRFAVAAQAAVRRVEKTLGDYIAHANESRQEDERILRTLEEQRDVIPPEFRATMRPPPAPSTQKRRMP